MARTPSKTPEEAIQEVGIKRGNMKFVASSIVLPLRRFLTAMGIPGAYVASMTRQEWIACYNDSTNAEIERHKTIARDKGEQGDAPDDDNGEDNNVPPVIVNQPQRPHNPSPLGALDAAIELIVENVLSRRSPAIDQGAVLDIVRRELANVEPRVLIIQERGKAEIKIDARVPMWFERVVKLLKYGARDRVNVCLVGPTGCGKTHMVALIAHALGCERHTILSGSAGATESDFKGKLLPTGEGGRFEYAASDFVKCYEGGNALICFDEIDAFDDNMLMVVNVPLANGHMYVHQRYTNPLINRGENVYFMATANTFGTSANPIYSARNKLDGATLDRFLMVSVEYDTHYEEEAGLARGLSPAEIGRLWDLRAKVREKGLRRAISTRAFLKAAVMRQCGDDWSTVVDTLTAGWTEDEKSKVGLAA